MEDYLEFYYTSPKYKQNHNMERQLTLLKMEVHRALRRFPIKELYRQLRVVIPQNCTVKSLKELREIVSKIPPSPQGLESSVFFKDFFKNLEYVRYIVHCKIYAVLYEFYYDTSFIRLKELHVKRRGLVRGQGQGLSPDLVRDVGELCRQLFFNIVRLKDIVNTESEIDPILFDETSADYISQFKDCKRFQNLLRLVPDVLIKSDMSLELAEEIRQKLAGNPSSDSGLSSSSEMEAPSVASKAPNQNRTRQKATNDVPIGKQPSLIRNNKVKSLEDMDMERTSYVKKPPPQAGNQDRMKKSRSLERSRGSNTNPNPDTFRDASREDEQSEYSQPVAEKHAKKTSDRLPPKRGMGQEPREAKAGSKSEDPEDKEEQVTPQGQRSHPTMGKQQTKNRPGVRNQTGGIPKDESVAEATGENTRGQNDEDGTAKVTKLPSLEANRRSKKARDQDTYTSSKNQRNISPENKENGKMPSIHNDGNDKGRRKAPAQERSKNAKTVSKTRPEESLQRTAKEVPVSVMKSTEDGMEALSLEKEFESKEQEPRDSGPLSWQEKKLEKLRQKLEELIESTETQQAALNLLTAVKDDLARAISKYRGSYRLKRELQDKVTLLTDIAHGWQKVTKSLHYQHWLQTRDLRLEMKLNGSFYRFNYILKERLAYLNDTVQKERPGRIEKLLQELGTLKKTTDKMPDYGIPFDRDYDDYELEFGRLAGYGLDYWPAYGNRYGRLRPDMPSRFLRDEELLLGRSLQSRYERSIWEALKSESVDSISLMSPEDSFYFASRVLENADGGQGDGERRGYQGDDDSNPESDPDDDENCNKKKQPEMYDQKRDEKQAPAFVPI